MDIEEKSDNYIIPEIKGVEAAGNEELSPDSKVLIEQAEGSGEDDTSLRKRFIDSKVSKKQAQYERILLYNRLQLLKAESLKVKSYLMW